jgi:hypothetical protein
MFAISGVEALGYLASALVILSLTMRSVVRLRLISLCGSLTFLVYGFLIESPPVMVTNGSIALINLWFLRQEFFVKAADRHDLGVSRIRPDSPFLTDFIEYHAGDIGRFQPDFTMPFGDDVVSLLLTRDGLPAGLLVGHRSGDTLAIDLDYVLREHRDSRIGQWIYGPGADVFRDDGIDRLTATALTVDHERYLRRVGFTATDTADGPTVFERCLTP